MKLGEVIQATTQEFVAQGYELHQPPPFASLVRTREGQIDIFGVVYQAGTGSIEPGRRPLARGKDQAEEEDIFRSHPELAQLLRTEFRAWVVGHRAESYSPALPPRPPHIHSFVYACSPEEMGSLGSCLDFLTPLVAAPFPSRDELVSRLLLSLAQHQEDPQGYLVRAGKELTLLLRRDGARLRGLLRGLRP